MSLTLMIILLLTMVSASPAHAMHIPDGILPLPWVLAWFAVAAPFVAYGIKRLNDLSREDLSFKPLVGLLAAVVFIISCMPIPLPTGTSSHPCGTGIAAILVGPFISVIIATVAVLIQSLFLSHGGLSALGAHIVSMGIAGSFAAWFVFKGLRRFRLSIAVAAFAAGVAADWMTYLMTSVELALGIRGAEPFYPLFWKIIVAFIPTQLPLGILEGAITAGMVMLLYRKRPDLLVRMKVIEGVKAQG